MRQEYVDMEFVNLVGPAQALEFTTVDEVPNPADCSHATTVCSECRPQWEEDYEILDDLLD